MKKIKYQLFMECLQFVKNLRLSFIEQLLNIQTTALVYPSPTKPDLANLGCLKQTIKVNC